MRSNGSEKSSVKLRDPSMSSTLGMSIIQPLLAIKAKKIVMGGSVLFVQARGCAIEQDRSRRISKFVLRTGMCTWLRTRTRPGGS
jgi:hypothetical protein